MQQTYAKSKALFLLAIDFIAQGFPFATEETKALRYCLVGGISPPASNLQHYANTRARYF